MDGVRKRRAVPDTERIRASRTQTAARIRDYPTEEWLACEPDVIFDATKEAFPKISRAHFITDLHRVAREATDEVRESSTDPAALGYVAHTMTGDGRGPEELSFWFERVPLDQCPTPKPRASRRQARAPQAYGISPEIAAKTGLPATAAPPQGYVDGTGAPIAPIAAERTDLEPAAAPEWCNGDGKYGFHRYGSPPPGVAVCVCGTADEEPPAPAPVEPSAPTGTFPAPPPFPGAP